jgi:hypothetical protein
MARNENRQKGKIAHYVHVHQRSPKVISLVVRSSCGRCAQRLRRIRECDHVDADDTPSDHHADLAAPHFSISETYVYFVCPTRHGIDEPPDRQCLIRINTDLMNINELKPTQMNGIYSQFKIRWDITRQHIGAFTGQIFLRTTVFGHFPVCGIPPVSVFCFHGNGLFDLKGHPSRCPIFREIQTRVLSTPESAGLNRWGDFQQTLDHGRYNI